MAVDEFGRELPHRRRNSVSPSPSYHRSSRRRGRADSFRGGGGRDDDDDLPRPRSHSRDNVEGRKRKHPSERYADQPLLCQFVWEQQLQRQHRADTLDKDDPSSPPQQEVVSDEDKSPPPLFASPEEATAQYYDYNSKYCLNYVRTFFNSHLDDAWFRLRLSPLVQYRHAANEKTRANAEATEFRKEILHSLEESNLGVIPKKDPDCPDYLGPPKCSFVSSCRLGVGTKPTASVHRGPSSSSRHDPYDDGYILQGEDRNRIERHAKSHLHSFVKTDACFKIGEVPPHITDDMISNAVLRYCPERKEVSVWSGDVSAKDFDDEATSLLPYHRTVFCSFPSREAKEAMLEKLNRYDEDHAVGRRRSSRMPRFLELEVDCTDVYGRRDVDADGRGGAPPGKGKSGGLPPKSCRVMVNTGSLTSQQPVSVLSAAVSSRERIKRDRASVTTLASTLDEVREITRGNRLADLLRLLFPSEVEWAAVDDEDVLDVSIAYLRRVHLFSFYNGCTMAKSVGSVLTYSHPVGTIHLRLRNADEILKKTAEEKGGTVMEVSPGEDGDDASGNNTPVAKDMLVMRLNDSIAKALEYVSKMGDRGPGCLIDEETDAAARQIESAERQAKVAWLENHGMIDEDGRARCSFHWCKKLFKDKAFLQKHLLKKHSDHLRAECAKCHDQSMMIAWDNDENRPVPPVLVDCGAKFGNVPSAVVGSHKPIAHDPEPQLWKEEEERMAEEERRRQEQEEEERLAEEERRRAEQRRQEAMAGEKRKGNYVDVDDMVEEKVELKLDDVAVVPPAKKKKKKKSLL
ncbi:hypothetical protein HJC23_002311 [Cyclotella cryptica]|uniref:C2H2-type domain-containing protein n=1 Tax=Cyclotella cryptica TaxID=29204 RepID=A0ABD3QKJ8_9STRA